MTSPGVVIYRICRQCGKSWNVSGIDKGGGKHYICPTCAYRMKIKRHPYRKENTNDSDRE